MGKWAVFLHPVQRQIVERDFSGPARVFGTAGTGKTIVALHRAVHLARDNPDARVLLTTFSDTLADALRTKLTRLCRSSSMICWCSHPVRLREEARKVALPVVG